MVDVPLIGVQTGVVSVSTAMRECARVLSRSDLRTPLGMWECLSTCGVQGLTTGGWVGGDGGAGEPAGLRSVAAGRQGVVRLLLLFPESG